MRFGRWLSIAGALFFAVYGLAFSFFPHELSLLVTDSTPLSSSAVIDMRATYGGMSLAIGCILVILSRKDSTLHFAVAGLMILMLGMASTRTIGIVVDGDPNDIMFLYLGLEILVAALCAYWLKRFVEVDV